MAGGFDKYQFRVDGNTLWLTSKSTDITFRVGDRLVAGSEAESPLKQQEGRPNDRINLTWFALAR